jgi:K+-sensing histidine kinase KdpD
MLSARAIAPIAIACALITSVTSLLWAIGAPDPNHLIFLYLLPIAAVAFAFGSLAGFVAGALAALLGTYFLYEPLYTFYFSDLRGLGEVAWFSLTAVLCTKCVSEIRRS